MADRIIVVDGDGSAVATTGHVPGWGQHWRARVVTFGDRREALAVRARVRAGEELWVVGAPPAWGGGGPTYRVLRLIRGGTLVTRVPTSLPPWERGVAEQVV